MKRHRRRHLRNPRRRSRGGISIGSILTLAVIGGAGYYLYQNGSDIMASLQSSLSSVAALPGQAASYVGSEVTAGEQAASDYISGLESDVSNSVTGIEGLVSNEFTSLENGVNSFWQSL